MYVLLLGHNGAERRVVSSEMDVLASEGDGHEFYVSGDMQPGTYSARVQCSGDTSESGESGTFRITPKADALLLVGPKQGAVCLIGHTCEISRASSVRGVSSRCASIIVAVLDGAHIVLLNFSMPNFASGETTGHHALYLPGWLTPASHVHLELYCAGDSSVRVASQAFRLAQDQGALELTQPRRGAVWSTGQDHTIKWPTSLRSSPK